MYRVALASKARIPASSRRQIGTRVGWSTIYATNDINFGVEARTLMLKGLEEPADVVKVTMGPKDHCEMKRSAPWEEAHAISSDSDSEEDVLKLKKLSEAAELRRKRQGGMSYEALSRHGYGGGPSVLKVPPPRAVEKEQDWSWSVGKRGGGGDDDGNGESYEERERTRDAVMQGEKLLDVQMRSHECKKEKGVTFSQKEKRKRDLGQASRAKNYVEEEKRLLRDNGVYSGFDS